MRESMVGGTDWVDGSATVISSSGSWSNFLNENGSGLAKYVIGFEYVVSGKRYIGRFEQYEPLVEGTTLKLLFNPRRPGQNSLADFPVRGWTHVAAIGLGLGFAWFVHYLSQRFGLGGKWTKY